MQNKISFEENHKRKITTFKKKSVAITLSIFFSFFPWLYIYGINKKKFWIALLIVVIGLIIFYSAIIHSFFTGGVELFIGYGVIIRLILILSNAGIYIWSLVDSIRRSRSFYLSYPNGTP